LSVEIRIRAGELGDFSRRLRAWASSQLPFATAAALTDVARLARDEVRERLPRHFKVRNQAWRKSVVQMLPADKRDAPIQAAVYVPRWAPWMEAHVAGGTKRSRGAARVAVPSRITAARRSASGRIPKRWKPRSLRARKGLEEAALRLGQIVVRGVRGAGGAIFYHLVSSARIRPRWPMGDEVNEVVGRELGRAAARRLEQALR